jgi:hypothetical protein
MRLGMILPAKFLLVAGLSHASRAILNNVPSSPTSLNDPISSLQLGYEPCINESSVVYHSSGAPSFSKTFAICLENALDPLLFGGYATGTLIPFEAQVSLNNVVAVNEVENTVTIDFLLRVYWTDARLSMPALWDAMGTSVQASGVDLMQYVDSGNPGFWKPDFVFSEASSMEVTNEFLKLYPGGFVYWNRHIQMTLFSTTLHYQKYPGNNTACVASF